MAKFIEALWIVGVSACVVSPMYGYAMDSGDLGFCVFLTGLLACIGAMFTRGAWKV